MIYLTRVGDRYYAVGIGWVRDLREDVESVVYSLYHSNLVLITKLRSKRELCSMDHNAEYSNTYF